MNAVLTLLALLAGLFAPGYCVARRMIPDADLVERWILAVGTGIFLVPACTFVVAWASGLEFSRLLVLGVALGVVLACRPWGLEAPLPAPRRDGATRTGLLVLAALLAGAALALLATDLRFGGRLGLFHPCLQEMAGYLGQHDGSGWTLFDPGTGHHVTHVFEHETDEVLGLEYITNNQRIANGAIVASLLVLAGRAGLELVTLLMYFLVAGGGYLVARPLVPREPTRVAVGLVTLVAVHGLIAYMVNETVFAFAAGVLVLALVTRPPRAPRALAAAGSLLGMAAGSRLAALAWLLPVALWLRGRPIGHRLVAAAAFVASLAPWFAARWLVTGDPFSHFQQEGARIPHAVLGWEFAFRPLNWPFVDTLVAQPGDVLPPALLVPLAALRSMGVLVAAAALAGLVVMLRSHRRLALVVLTWSLPIGAFLLVQGYIDYEKTSWLLLGAPVLPLTLAVFAARLSAREGRRGPIIVWALAALALAQVPGWASGLRFETDTRAYVMVEAQVVRPPRTESERRRELGEVRLLPSLQGVSRPPRLLSALTAVADSEPFRSGHLVVWQVLSPDGDLAFAVEPTTAEPELPRLFAADTFGDLLRWEGVFLVHLRLPTSPDVHAELRWEEDRFELDVDPGQGPRELRHIAFFVAHAEAYPDVSVRFDGAPLPVDRVGYEISLDPKVDAPPFLDLRLVTNLPAARAETGRPLTLELGPQVWRIVPTVFGEGPPAAAGLPPSKWLCVTLGRPCSQL